MLVVWSAKKPLFIPDLKRQLQAHASDDALYPLFCNLGKKPFNTANPAPIISPISFASSSLPTQPSPVPLPIKKEHFHDPNDRLLSSPNQPKSGERHASMWKTHLTPFPEPLTP